MNFVSFHLNTYWFWLLRRWIKSYVHSKLTIPIIIYDMSRSHYNSFRNKKTGSIRNSPFFFYILLILLIILKHTLNYSYPMIRMFKWKSNHFSFIRFRFRIASIFILKTITLKWQFIISLMNNEFHKKEYLW